MNGTSTARDDSVAHPRSSGRSACLWTAALRRLTAVREHLTDVEARIARARQFRVNQSYAMRGALREALRER